LLRIAIFTLSISLLLPASFAQSNLQTKHEQIIDSLKRDDYLQARQRLEALRRSSPEIFTRNNYDYLLARLLQREGELSLAAQAYESVVARRSPLSEYALWHLGEIARQQSNLKEEQQLLSRLLVANPQSLLAQKARQRLGKSYLESNNYGAAIAALQPISGTQADTARSALARIGQAQFAAGNTTGARATFERLLAGQRDDSALVAAEYLDKLDSQAGRALSESDLITRARVYFFNRRFAQARAHFMKLVESFPQSRFLPEAMFQTGRAYYLEDQFEESTGWFERVHSRFPQTSEGEQGFYQAGHARQRLGRYREAVARYEEFIKAYPKSEFIGGAHLNAIDSLRYAGLDAEAISWCDRTQNDPRLAGELAATTALFNKAKIYLTRGNLEAALGVLTGLLSHNLNRQGPGSTNRDEVAFMRGYCLEQLGRVGEAIEIYLSIPDERDRYYGRRATFRLLALAARPQSQALIAQRVTELREQARESLSRKQYGTAKAAANQALRLSQAAPLVTEMNNILRECYQNLPEYQKVNQFKLASFGRQVIVDRAPPVTNRSHLGIATELIFLGLYDEGAPELQAANLRSASSDQTDREKDGASKSAPVVKARGGPGSAQHRRRSGATQAAKRSRPAQAPRVGNWPYTLAVFSNRGNHADRALNFAESVFSGIPKDYKLDLLPRDLVELLYPAPYRDVLRQQAIPRGIDPRFLLAIARQESRFRADAKSPAAARGLMQFTPSAVDRIAAVLQLNNFDQDDLYRPEVSILFGAQLMQEIFKLFPDNPYAAAVAYNGSEAAAERWLKRSGSNDPDRFVIEVGYRESKDYVFKVMSNYWAYQQIYTEKLERR